MKIPKMNRTYHDIMMYDVKGIDSFLDAIDHEIKFLKLIVNDYRNGEEIKLFGKEFKLNEGDDELQEEVSLVDRIRKIRNGNPQKRILERLLIMQKNLNNVIEKRKWKNIDAIRFVDKTGTWKSAGDFRQKLRDKFGTDRVHICGFHMSLEQAKICQSSTAELKKYAMPSFKKVELINPEPLPIIEWIEYEVRTPIFEKNNTPFGILGQLLSFERFKIKRYLNIILKMNDN
jgi:hypothetical protein